MKTAADYHNLQKGKDGKAYVKYEGDVAILFLDRGENRMNDLFIESFNAALDEVESKENIKAVITTGVGKFYCNGLDLEWMMALAANLPDHLKLFLENWHKLLARILTFPILTVAALNGHCFAGGGLLALAHDYRVMNTEQGWFCLNEVHINLRFAPWMMRLLNQRMPSPKASTEFVLLGKRCTAKEAEELGLVEGVGSKADLLKLAQTFTSKVLPPNPVINRSSLADMKSDFYKEILEKMSDDTSVLDGFKSRL